LKSNSEGLALKSLALLLALSLYAACKSNANNSTVTTNQTTTVSKSSPSASATSSPSAKPTPDSTSSSELHTPPDGSPERKAILDAVSAELKRKDNFEKAVFDVESIKVHNGWAYIVTDVDAPDGEPYGLVEALLQEQGGQWKVSEVFDAPGGGVREERDARAKFRARFANAPDDIFPPMQ
jgi:hypothetical protein